MFQVIQPHTIPGSNNLPTKFHLNRSAGLSAEEYYSHRQTDRPFCIYKKMYDMHIYILVMKVACLEMWLEEQVETGCGCS